MWKGDNYCHIPTSLLHFLHQIARRLKLYFFPAIKHEEMVRSPVSLEKVINDEKTLTEMELYEEDGVDDMDEKIIDEDEKALSGKHMHMKLKFHHN